MKRALGLALSLAACSGAAGEPSTDDLRAALAQAGNRGAAKAEKLACKSSPDRPGQVCDYRAPACNRFTGTCGAPKPFTGRFLYAAGRWQLVDDLTAKPAPDPATQPLPGVALVTPAALATVGPPLNVDLPPAPPVAAPAPAAPETELSRKELRQVARWRELDARCREDAGDDEACYDRDRLGERLERRGLCYGAPGAFGYDRAWRPCARRTEERP